MNCVFLAFMVSVSISVFVQDMMGVAVAGDSKEKVVFSVENIIATGSEGEISTKIYPGYTMSFDVAIVSGFSQKQESIFFEYSIIDQDDKVVYSIAEETQIPGGNVFTKKMTLPGNLEPGTYKLRIKSTVEDQSMIQEQFFEVQQSPVVTLEKNTKYFLASFFEESNGLFLGGLITGFLIVIFSAIFFVMHKRNQTKYHSN